MEKMDELVARFHSLQGNTLQEVKRNFNELLEAIQRDVTREADLNALIASINPKTKLGSSLKIDILIRFKRYDALLEVLKSGNSMLIGKVLKCWKFFEVIFNKIDAQTLVGQIFPHISFSARMKIITKLSMNLKNEELADSYFYAIEDKYGLFVAKGLLPACSLDLIKSTVTSYKVILSSRQLLRIVKRDREFLRYYFDVLHETHGEDFSGKYSEVLRYVAKIDDQLFWELYKKYQLKVKFGHRMTPKLYENAKEFLTSSDYKLGIFKFVKIYKIIRKSDVDLRKFILELYPKELDIFLAEFSGYDLRIFIGYLPENKKYVIVNGCFKERYGKNVYEFLTVDIPEEILQLIPDQEREVFVDKKLGQDENLIYMYPTKKSIPLLRERIKYTSNISKRSELTVLLCKTCRFNKDPEGLLEVLRYMRLRHKNDKSILIDFLINLCGWSDTKSFNGEHWVLIYELLKLVMPNYRMYYYGTYLMRKYLLYALKNKLSCDEFMRTFLKYLIEEGGYFDSQFDDVECEKFYYESCAELLPQMSQGEDFIRLSCSFLSAIARFNVRRPKNKIIISGYSELMSSVKFQLTSIDYYNAETVINYCLKFEYNDIYDQLYWENFQRTCNSDMVIWYLQNKPEKVLAHIDDVLVTLPVHSRKYQLPKLFRSISLFSFDEISQKVISFALGGIHHDDLKVAKFSATALSYLTKEDEYFEIIETFLPPLDGKIDLNTMAENYVCVQEVLVNGLSNFNCSISCLPLLLKFCIGDYMKYTLASLYRIANRIPESKLKDFLDSLYQSAVSVRKHAVDLTKRLETKERVHNFLNASGEGDKHASLQKIIFKSTLSYFSANPSQELWDLLKKNMKIIDKGDQEAFVCLVNVGKIPPEYQPEYVQIVYEILANNNNNEICTKKYDLLTAASNNLIKKLDVPFLKYAIRDTLLQPNIPENDFYLRSVFYKTSEKQMDILNEVLDVIKTYIEKNWTDYAKGELRKNVYDIIRNFCLRAIKIKSDNIPVEKFLEFWSSKIKNGEFLEEYLLLQLTNAYLVCLSEAKYREYGVRVSVILAEWIGLHGPSVISMFTEESVNFLKEFLDSYDKQMGFVDGLLQANGNDFNNILVLNVIFGLVSSNNIKYQFDFALEKLRKTESTVVQIHLHRFLRDVVL